MSETLLLGLVFAALLGLDWRYGLKTVRIAAAVLAVGVWLNAQPVPGRALRWALAAPHSERVTRVADDPPLSEYASGVRTMAKAVVADAKMDAYTRLLSMGVLFWLACSPVFRRVRGPSVEARTNASAGKENSS